VAILERVKTEFRKLKYLDDFDVFIDRLNALTWRFTKRIDSPATIKPGIGFFNFSLKCVK
jgi:hypothetical protein